MTCTICKKLIRRKDFRVTWRDHMLRKFHGCQTCNENGSFDKFIDALPKLKYPTIRSGKIL